MASVNKVILIGNLGRDPEIRFTPGGAQVCNFTLATNEQWKDKSGQRQERTEWHRIVVWGKQAEICKEYLAKGRQVYVEGSLQTREWNDRDGNKRTTTEIRAIRIQLLGRADGARAEGAPAGPIGSGAPDAQQGLHDYPFPVDPLIPGGGLYHGVFSRDLIRRQGQVETLPGGGNDVQIGHGRLDHDHVRALLNVQLDLPHGFAQVRAVHLVRAAVTKLRR